MSFKVGDKVRLTGKGWDGEGLVPGVGDIVTLTSNVSFFENGNTWYVFDNPKARWGAELVSDTPDVLDTLANADIKAEHIERLEQIVRDAKDKALNRWRSTQHPEYTIEAINHQTDIELKVRREGTAGFKSVDKAERTKPVGFTPEEWAVVREYQGDDDLPTEPGVYVPQDLVNRLGCTYVYQLDDCEAPEWYVFTAEGIARGDEARVLLRDVYEKFGGLVRLGVVE